MIVQVKDNSGALEARVIQVLKGKKGRIGDKVVVSILKVQPQSQIKKGTVHKAILIRTKRGICRQDGSWLKFDENSIILVNEEGVPLASRILGPLPLELCRYSKISHLTTLFI